MTRLESLKWLLKPKNLLIIWTVLASVAALGFFSAYPDFFKDGGQWSLAVADEHVRVSDKGVTGVDLYRVKVTPKGSPALTPDNRKIISSQLLAVAVHSRVKEAGSYELVVKLLDSDKVLAQSKPAIFEFKQGDFEEFHAKVLTLRTPPDLKAKAYVLRIESSGPNGIRGEWEMDVEDV